MCVCVCVHGYHRNESDRLRSKIADQERLFRLTNNTATTEEALSSMNTLVQTLEKELDKKKRQRLTTPMERILKRRNRRNSRLKSRAPPPTAESSTSPRTIVNLSRVELSNNKISEELKFAPQPPRINCFQLIQDLKAFGRRMRLHGFFFDPDAGENKQYDPETRRFIEKSSWNPPRNRGVSLKRMAGASADPPEGRTPNPRRTQSPVQSTNPNRPHHQAR